MKTIKKFASLIIVSFVLISSCKKDDDNSSNSGSPVIVIPIQNIKQALVPRASTSSFAIISGSSITSIGASVITGDMGLSPGSSIGGFPPGILNGSQHINDSLINKAKLDLSSAYNDAAGRSTSEMVTLSGNLGGLTLTPGLYKSTSSLAISSGDLTFDALGDTAATFVIQLASTLTTTSGRQVILAGGAQASHIYWQVGSSATFGTTSVFKGIVMVQQSITFNTGASLDGCAFARNGGITLKGNTIVNP